MAKRIVHREWAVQDEKELKRHSRNKTPVKAISKALKRTPAAIRQKAHSLGISVGHQQRTKKRSKKAG